LSQPARVAGAERCSANSPRHPPEGEQASLGAARREASRLRLLDDFMKRTSFASTATTDPGPAPVAIASPHSEISLWWISLSPTVESGSLATELSDAEHERMQRFATDVLRHRYLIGRIALRRLLGRALGVESAAVPIERGPRGRPQLKGIRDIDFNVSHTNDAALIAIARHVKVGVDVERADRSIHSLGIARKFLTERERVALPSDPDQARQRILRLWTCKEALSKATGDALSAPFRQLDIEIEPSLRLTDGPPPYDPRDFVLIAADAPSSHFATIAVWRQNNAAAI
jgi:4'-phosphopantetheinyl transferase